MEYWDKSPSIVHIAKMKGATKNQAQHSDRHRYLSLQQEVAELRKGSTVEVTSDEEGFKDAWFVATLLKLPSITPLKPSSTKKKKNPNYDKAYVEYQNLISDEDPSVRLREFVNAAFIRPLPPQETRSRPFELGDIVDANYSDGWWTGVITRLLRGSRFLVAFQNPPHEIEFGLSDLRYHLEWVKGNWLRPVNLVQSSARISIFLYTVTLFSPCRFFFF